MGSPEVSSMQWVECGPWDQIAWVQPPALPLITWEAPLCALASLSVKWDFGSTCLIGH